MSDNLTQNFKIWSVRAWKIYLSILNRKSCIRSKLSSFNYKHNLTSKNTFVFFSFTCNVCTFKYSHFIEPRVEGQKVTSQYLLEITNNTNYKVFWRCFETKVVGQIDDGQPRKWIRKVFKETSLIEFLTYLKLNLQNFIKHNFVVHWQDYHCRLTMLNLLEDIILSHIDFAKYYTFILK